MKSNSKNLDDLRDLFSVFHDGGILSWKEGASVANVRIECQYLAELINPEFEWFGVQIRILKPTLFSAWNRTGENQLKVLATTDLFQKTEPEILSSEIEIQLVKVVANTHHTDDLAGGIIWIDGEIESIEDQNHRQLSLDEVKRIATGYWNRMN